MSAWREELAEAFGLPSPSLASTTLTARKMGPQALCRMCLRPEAKRGHDGYWVVLDGARPLTRHHIVPEAWFRRQPLHVRRIRNAHANVVPLCRPCHDLVESIDPFEREQARRHLRRSMTQQEVAFVIALMGQQWLDAHYPRDLKARASVAAVDEG